MSPGAQGADGEHAAPSVAVPFGIAHWAYERIAPVDSCPMRHAVPGDVQPVFAAGSHVSAHSITGRTPPLPSETWREQVLPGQSLSCLQNAAQSEALPVAVFVAMHAEPATQPCVEQSWPGVPMPTIAQKWAPIASMVHSSLAPQPH